MRIRNLLTLTVLLGGTAMMAAPAIAQSIPGSPGTITTDGASRAAPLAISGIKPMPTPQVDTDSISRGPFGQDPADALAGLGTTTWHPDGSVTQSPPSDKTRDIFTEEVKGATAAEFATQRVLNPVQTRTQVTPAGDVRALDYPYYVVGWLIMKDQAGNYGTCTATLIGPQSVLTAAHCVYDHDTGGWMAEITFVPGLTDGENPPFGVYVPSAVDILTGYIDNYDGENYGSVMPWDLAVITLSEPSVADDQGNTLGWLGFGVDDASAYDATMIGYPGDKPDGTMWESKCEIPDEFFGDLIFAHLCDMYSGNSGSSMFAVSGQDYTVRGVNVAENEELNFGVRLTDTYFQWVLDHYVYPQ